MRTLAAVLAIAALTGCATLDKEAQRNLAAQEKNSDAVNLAAIQAGQIDKLLSSATSNVDKGFRLQDSGRDVVRDTKGDVVYVDVLGPNGPIKAPLYSQWSTDISLNAYADLANGVQGLHLAVGDIAQGLTGNAAYSSIPRRNGLSLTIQNAGGTTTNADAISKYMTGKTDRTKVAGDALVNAVTAEWRGKALAIGETVALIKAGGEVAVGIIQAVNPIAGAVGLARVVLEDGTTEVVKGPE